MVYNRPAGYERVCLQSPVFCFPPETRQHKSPKLTGVRNSEGVSCDQMGSLEGGLQKFRRRRPQLPLQGGYLPRKPSCGQNLGMAVKVSLSPVRAFLTSGEKGCPQSICLWEESSWVTLVSGLLGNQMSRPLPTLLFQQGLPLHLGKSPLAPWRTEYLSVLKGGR